MTGHQPELVNFILPGVYVKMLKTVVLLLACVYAVAGEDEGDWIEPEDRDPATFDDGHSLRMSQHTRDSINCGAASLFHQYVSAFFAILHVGIANAPARVRRIGGF